ncbi:ankyrin repeat domain-containing protein [Candidatus Dependentiae bacterium]|nr:ankyrin repeat domain-containing protein [Candidatus Dependentiae bacterium]
MKSIILLFTISLNSLQAAVLEDYLRIRPVEVKLSRAVNDNDLPTLVSLLVHHNFTINQPINRWNSTLLHKAVTNQSPLIVLFLLFTPGINVNPKDSAGFTPLSLSVQKSSDPTERLNIFIIHALLLAGADKHIPNICNRSPLDIVYDLPDDHPDKAPVLQLFGINPTAPQPPRSPAITLPELRRARLAGEQQETATQTTPADFAVPTGKSRRKRVRPHKYDSSDESEATADLMEATPAEKARPTFAPRPSSYPGSRRYQGLQNTSPTKKSKNVKASTEADLGWATPDGRP